MDDHQDNPPATHQVIVNAQDQFVVWPSQLQPPAGWRGIGVHGSRGELDLYLRKLATETMPMPLMISDQQTLDTRWD